MVLERAVPMSYFHVAVGRGMGVVDARSLVMTFRDFETWEFALKFS